jgi:hypothetical protein
MSRVNSSDGHYTTEVFEPSCTSGFTLRSGWLAQQDQPTFEAFLQPLKHLEWPILAVRSDKQKGLGPAVAAVVPQRRHPCCQAPSLRHLAAPLAEADAAFQMALRQSVRQQVGDVLRQDSRTEPDQAGVLTVTGLVPRPLAQPATPGSQSPPARDPRTAPESTADAVLPHLMRHTRSLRTLTGRPPSRLAGLETSERLQHVAQGSLDLLAERYDPRLAQLYQGLQAALCPLAQTSQDVPQGAAWLRDIASILAPTALQAVCGAQVAEQRRDSLDTV